MNFQIYVVHEFLTTFKSINCYGSTVHHLVGARQLGSVRPRAETDKRLRRGRARPASDVDRVRARDRQRVLDGGPAEQQELLLPDGATPSTKPLHLFRAKFCRKHGAKVPRT